MNPVFFNCFLLFILVIFLSLLQTRFKMLKEEPVSFLVMLIIVPLYVFGKAKAKTWTELTGIEVLIYTLTMAYINTKSMIPKINEGYIYAYTLFHWYLLFDTINTHGFNFWTFLVTFISLYPSYLIIRSAFEHKVMDKKVKILLYYWFLFTIIFTYADQLFLDIVKPVAALYEINFLNFMTVFVSAVQLYFISAICSLLFLGFPFFHIDKGNEPFSIRWKRAKIAWKRILNHSLDNYIDYQINGVQVFFITTLSLVLFYIDAVDNFRSTLIFIYTVVVPVIFFYLKLSPDNNVEQPSDT